MGKLIYISLFISICLNSCNKSSENNESKLDASSSSKYTNRTEVLVGVTDTNQHPIVFADGSGLSEDLCKALNESQDKYYFKNVLCPTKRLRELARRGQVHLAAFQNLKWSWRDQSDKKSKTLLNDKDIFITLNKEGISHDIFKFGKANSVALVQGFHYSFLKSQEAGDKPLVMKVRDESAIVEVVLNGQAEFGVVSKALIDYVKAKDQETYEKLLVSEKFDSEYERYYVIMNSSPIQDTELNSILSIIDKNGKLQKIFEKYGLKSPEISNY